MGGFSRRAFLFSGVCGAAMAADGALARSITGIPWTPGTADTPHVPDGSFLTTAERRTLDAFCQRLIPADETGPGAREAGVGDFIDRQLSGFYGRGDRWYMQGPFEDGTDEQGYHSEHAPAALYRAALKALQDHCAKEFSGRGFADLSPDEQDELISALQEGEIEFDGVSASAFFELALDNTIEGFFCDPLYGGNRDMVGWKLVGFPGARYDYRPYLNHNGSPIALEPVGLMGRPAWNPR